MNDERDDDLKRADLRAFFKAIPRSEAVRLLEAFGAGLFDPKPIGTARPYCLPIPKLAPEPAKEPEEEQVTPIVGMSLSDVAKQALLDHLEAQKRKPTPRRFFRRPPLV